MTAHPAFSVLGIELEYAIVARDSLAVRPVAHELLQRCAASPCEGPGALGWSNELVAHVVELKNAQPLPPASLTPAPFAAAVRAANDALAAHDACLLGSAMHPWMDPARETTLWTHTDAAIYRAYDALFDCARHGWANLQSMHVNLPFAGDDEFRRVHAAARVVLPLIPALAASSPLAEGTDTGHRDYRLCVYAGNSARFPEITGAVVPDPASSRGDYERRVLRPMYAAIAPFDPDGVLQHEWLNARGAIPRFARNAVEIRVTDVQECPRADVALAKAITVVAAALYRETWSAVAAQEALPTAMLASLLMRCAQAGEEARVDDPAYLAVLGLPAAPRRAADVWRLLFARLAADIPDPEEQETLSHILRHGTLATRILRRTGAQPARDRLREVYVELANCLQDGRLFI